jgi:hypothetical protein
MGVRAPRSLTIAVELRTIVARLLEQEPGAALCDACLAFAAAAPLIETRRVVEALVSMRPMLKRSLNHCESCRRDHGDAVPAGTRWRRETGIQVTAKRRGEAELEVFGILLACELRVPMLAKGPMAAKGGSSATYRSWPAPRDFFGSRSGGCDSGRTTLDHRSTDRHRSPSAAEMGHRDARDSSHGFLRWLW